MQKIEIEAKDVKYGINQSLAETGLHIRDRKWPSIYDVTSWRPWPESYGVTKLLFCIVCIV